MPAFAMNAPPVCGALIFRVAVLIVTLAKAPIAPLRTASNY
jgi:hypothetical protein